MNLAGANKSHVERYLVLISQSSDSRYITHFQVLCLVCMQQISLQAELAQLCEGEYLASIHGIGFIYGLLRLLGYLRIIRIQVMRAFRVIKQAYQGCQISNTLLAIIITTGCLRWQIRLFFSVLSSNATQDNHTPATKIISACRRL